MDIPVKFLIDNLTNLAKYHYDLISNAKGDLEKLNNDLRMLRAILESAPDKYKKDGIFKEWERQVRETIYQVEDAIDTYVTEIAVEKGKNIFGRTVAKVNRSSLAKQLRAASEKVELLSDEKKYISHLSLANNDDAASAETRQIREQRRQNKIVGVEDEAQKLIGYLNEQVDGIDVVSIIGMPGLGKTTVAWKIFQDQAIEFEFPTRIWVNISDDLNLNKVLRAILSHFITPALADSTPDDHLSYKVKEHLESGKYLIVMDDVWSIEAWEKLKYVLPASNKQGKILITSREEKVAYHSNVNRKPHKLRFLTEDESWDLLQHEVYDKVGSVPADLVEVGKFISKNCDGLPLSIVVIGGILKGKIAEARWIVPAIRRQWEEVSIRLERYLVEEDKTKRLQKIIRLSYEKLPYELRDCFLYLGVFPEDAFVPAKKLTLLWIAEGFVQGTDGKSLEETAHDNLKDLISRNLLMVEKEKIHNGEPKVCRVHDTIRQFCKTEAKFDNLNLFQEISWTNHGVFEPSHENVVQHRRLCIHSFIHEFFLKNPKLPKARTFLCSSKSAINFEARDIAPFTQAFHLVRVLDAKDIKFPKFPQKITNLIHLRYLTLTFTNDQVKFLPEAMSNLWNLQTLTVETAGRTLEIKADIWSMRHLRHFKTKASIVLRQDGQGKGGDNLQTIERLSPRSCTVTVFTKARNLVKLGIQGDLSSALYHNSLGVLGRLNKLQLVHRAESKIPACLPKASEFPANLKTLVLVSTNLDWGQMSLLADIGLLVLKLKENAFTGESWEAFGYSFKNLELLDIERADVKRWATSEECFPELRSLVLKNCEGIEEVPPVLHKLEMLSLERVTESAVTSAEKIKAIKGADFVLNIAPADKMKKALSLKSQTQE